LFERLTAWFRKGKEKIAAKIIKDKMNKNNKINRIAEILELKLEQGSADLKVKLKGETEQINLSFNYTLEENAICITNFETNKEWLNALADVFKEKYSKISLNVFGKDAGKLLKHLF
jgi:hypothetical protein